MIEGPERWWLPTGFGMVVGMSDAPADHQWFLHVNGQTVGPHTPAQLRQMAAAGSIAAATPICRGTSGDWRTCGDVKGLQFPASPVPQPPPAPSPAAVAGLPDDDDLPEVVVEDDAVTAAPVIRRTDPSGWYVPRVSYKAIRVLSVVLLVFAVLHYLFAVLGFAFWVAIGFADGMDDEAGPVPSGFFVAVVQFGPLLLGLLVGLLLHAASQLLLAFGQVAEDIRVIRNRTVR